MCVSHVFYDEGGRLGLNWYNLLLYAVRNSKCGAPLSGGYVCVTHANGPWLLTPDVVGLTRVCRG